VIKVACVLVLLGVPSLAAAQSVERVRVAGSGVSPAFPRGVSLALVSPAEYVRKAVAGAQGSWIGPDYWATGNRAQSGKASIQWSVSFDDHAGNYKAAALSAPKHGWPLDKKDPISVPHYVGRRVVGTIPGYYVITHGPAPDDASYDGAVAFPVAPRAFAIVRFQVLDPASDSAGAAGSYLVKGSIIPSFWNRGQIFWAFSGVRLVGNLPPTRVSLAVGRNRHRLAGSVADAFRNPVLGVPVRLERNVRGSWRRLTATRTNGRGSFSIRVRRGVYRAVAVFRGKRTVSPTVFAG
jgi:hypothetical protein